LTSVVLGSETWIFQSSNLLEQSVGRREFFEPLSPKEVHNVAAVSIEECVRVAVGCFQSMSHIREVAIIVPN